MSDVATPNEPAAVEEVASRTVEEAIAQGLVERAGPRAWSWSVLAGS
jgi:hypothetical protein